jgi:hypothetical protein
VKNRSIGIRGEAGPARSKTASNRLYSIYRRQARDARESTPQLALGVNALSPNEAVVDCQREGLTPRLTDGGARVSTERDGGKFRVLGSRLQRSEVPEPNAISSTRIMRT